MVNSDFIDTPVLLLVFNRPETTKRIFEVIQKVKPKQLFIAADGPRENNPYDEVLCEKVKKIISFVDWDCEVKTLFRDINLGCKLAPSLAITWFFEHVEEGIILEDDILPHIDFFRFAQKMLHQYADDERIMMISGFNVASCWKEEKQDYHFSLFGGCWGWATWRRAWTFFDPEIKKWSDPEVKKLLRENLGGGYDFEFRSKLYDQIHQGKLETVWDYQWTFARLVQSGLCIVPSLNTIENIGFTEGATHTKSQPEHLKELKVHNLPSSFRLNDFVMRDHEYDRFFTQLMQGSGSRLTLAFRLLKKLQWT
ncbi:hypothetical protein [Nafulsella turpanensis]|uniref:hypothetical protein n=1 Tax=Nafulsella turpanensis TaxID=1265690 RepID=UPI00034BC409|nr:hypothetical protein [Nafulsella turpanensis]